MPVSDYWFASRLNERYLFLGTTTAEVRRERIREKILELELADERLGNRNGQDETWRQAFERIYQDNLETGESCNA